MWCEQLESTIGHLARIRGQVGPSAPHVSVPKSREWWNDVGADQGHASPQRFYIDYVQCFLYRARANMRRLYRRLGGGCHKGWFEHSPPCYTDLYRYMKSLTWINAFPPAGKHRRVQGPCRLCARCVKSTGAVYAPRCFHKEGRPKVD